jgi:two-component system chemotaxis response regulator CheB
MPGHDIIVIAASAGGVEALKAMVKYLPQDLPASIFVVLHVPANGTSVLPSILTRSGQLPAAHAKDRESIEHGRIYVAPPDYHLLVKRDHVLLTRGPKENSNRPSADPLFRTAARWHSNRVVAVVLSGTLDDGTAGVISVKSRGGIAIAQDPAEALYAGMPMSAIENAPVDYVLSVAEIAGVLVRLANEPVEEKGGVPVPDDMEIETDMAELDADAMQQEKRLARLRATPVPNAAVCCGR